MDPNQPKRERCVMCPRKLKPHQSKFCSRLCAEGLKRRKARARDRERGKPDYSAFWHSVRHPVGVNIAERIGLTVEDLIRFAQAEIDRGELRGFYRDGELRAFGVPLAEGEVPLKVENRRKVPKAERHADRTRREQAMRDRHRERRRRHRRNQAERRRANV